MTPRNLLALEVYGALAKRVVIDLELQALVLELLGIRVTRAEGLSLIEALSAIHEARCPRPTRRPTDG